MHFPKKFLIAALLLLTLFSCEQESEHDITSVEITPVFIDDISVRAIEPLDEDRVFFAATNGKIGLVDGDTPKLAVIKYTDSLLQFRSIARTSEAAFVLSIASPAVLYKIGFDGTDATNINGL